MSRLVRLSLSLRLSRVMFSLLALSFAINLLAVSGQAQTFSPSVSTQISIPDGSGGTAPAQYPTSGSCTNAACIAVSGLTGSYTSMSVNLTFSPLDNNQTFASAAWLLESPDGQFLDMLSYGCADDAAQSSAINITVTLSDGAGSLFPADTVNCNSLANLNSGSNPETASYQPAHYDAGTADNFPSPGPGSSGYSIASPSGSSTFASTFCPSPSSCVSGLNGTWKLYAVDQGGLASPTQFTWSLTFSVTGSNAATTTSLAGGNPNPSFSSSPGNSVALTATVMSGGNPVSGGTVTFYDNTTSTTIALATVSGGTAAISPTFSTQGIHQLYAVYNGETGFASSTSPYVNQTVVNHAVESVNGSVTSFCNNGSISLSSDAAGNPYPAMIVLGPTNINGDTEPTLTGTIESVSVSLNSFSLANGEDLSDLGFALQAPGTAGAFSSNGNTFEFLSWAGNPYTSGSLVISDSGSSEIPYDQSPSCSGNICLPTDDEVDVGSDNLDTFPSPGPSSFDKAPPTGSSSFLTDFGGGGVSGTWSLYVDNRLSTAGSPGSIGSWCLNFTTQTNAHPTVLAVSGTPNPATFSSGTTGSATLSATVSVTDSSGLTVNAGTVTFDDGTTELGSAPVSNGVAALSSVLLSEGTHQIVASYSGTNIGTEFGISTGKFDQRVDKATKNPTSATGAGPYSFCNTGAIIAPGLGEDSGAAYPYPSNILVSNLPGTVKATTVTLNGFNTKDQGDLMSLLVGPSTNSNKWNNNFDFFSLTGSSVSFPSTNNLTFADGGVSIGGNNLESTGTYAPESNENLTFPECGQNASDCGTEKVGPPLGSSSTFTPTNYAGPKGTAVLGDVNEEGIFGGTTSSTYNGNGTWSLYLDDGGPLGGGEDTNLTQGWCVNLTVNQPAASVTASHAGTGTGGDFVQGEQNAPITVDITNNGPGSTGDPSLGSNPLTATDALPAGLTFGGVYSGTGWTCSGTTTVTCTNDSAVGDGASYPELTIDVNVTSNASTPLNNSVSISGAGVIPAASNIDAITVLVSTTTQAANAGTTFSESSQNVTLNATVAGNGSTVNNGTVTFAIYNGLTLIGTPLTSGTVTNGAASVSYGLPAATLAGTYTINATYNGSANFGSSSDTTHTLTVNSAVTSTSASNATATFSATDQTVGLNATVNSAAGAVNEGTVTFTVFNGGTQIGTAVTSGTVSSGSASANYTLPGNTIGGQYTITATYNPGADFSGSTNNGTLSVSQAPTITSGSGASFQVGAAGTFTVTSTGYPIPAFSITSGTLPSGVTLVDNGNGTATLAGTPGFNTTGSYPVTIQAANGIGSPYAQSFTLTVTAASILVVDVATDDAGTSTNCAAQTSPTVNTGNTSCSLRDALTESQALGAANIYFYPTTFTSATTITETNGTMAIPANTAIIGLTSGSGGSLTNLVTVNGATGSVYSLASGLSASLANLNITGGSAAPGNGGGINNLGTLAVTGSAIYNNSAIAGGGIYNDGALTVGSSSFYNNTASSANGGGIFNDSTGALTVTDSTFNNNSASSGSGGGIDNVSSTAVTVADSTISGNSANLGGGISNGGGTFTLTSSIVAGNSASTDADAAGAFTDGGYNLIGDGTGITGITNGTNGDQVGILGSPINPEVAPLGSYGGPTQIMLPLPGSTAICAGSASVIPSGVTTDQRGLPNTNTTYPGYSAGNPCVDVGAVQTNYALSFSQQPSNVNANAAISPAPAVSVSESGNLINGASVSISAAAGTLSGTSTQTTVAGIATFSGLSISQAESNDTLTASLNLPPLSIVSNSFNVSDVAPSLTSPSASPLGGPTQFTWNPGAGASMFALWIGTAQGSYNLYTTGHVANTVTSATFNVPANGATLHVRLWYELNGNWEYKDYTFTEDVAPALSSPSSSPVGGPTQFTWNPGTGSTMYALWIGTAQGSYDLYTTGHVANTVTSAKFNVPANGATLYVRLWYELNGEWEYTDYTFTDDVAPALTSPTSSPLGGPTQFTWNPGSGASMYALWIGTAQGGYNLYTTGHVANTVTSATFNVPVNGATIYVRLWYELNGDWEYTDYTFTEKQAPSLTGPTASPLSGSTQFTWSPGNVGASMFALWIGTSPGTNNLYTSGHVANTVTSETVNIPSNGATIYVSLWYELNGVWTYNVYTFTEAP